MIAFLEYVFAQNKDARSITFASIMQVCQVPEEAVELVVMKAMALELVKGSIDEIDKKVNIDWILPRYLNKGHLEVLVGQMKTWEDKTEMTIGIIEEGGEELLTS
jgi:26S proteasome regulatory subunit N9|tara:strand:- start:43 stop:357 length:315 start_codon:yes stop_codon:yes gene_type:complete